jgi:hypothetical protein
LGERLLCKQEVVGSIPSGSTRRFDLVAPFDPDCDPLCDRAPLQVTDRRLQYAASKQLLVRANSIRRVVDFAPMAFVGGARVIWHREEEIDPSAVRDWCHQRRAFSRHFLRLIFPATKVVRGYLRKQCFCRRSLTASSSDWSYEANWSF